MERIRAASIGLGWWGGVLAQAAARSKGVEVTTCYARTPETRERFAAEHGLRAAGSLDDVLADPDIDALIVATPHSHHLDVVRAAAGAGKHLFIEKPITLTVPEGRACVEAAEAAGIVLQVGHHRRRSAANRALKRMVDEGALGVIHLVEATMHVPKYLDPVDSWRATPDESPAGAMTALGVHMVDTFQYLLGPITRVTALSKRVLARWELDDITTIAFEFGSGPLGTLATSLVLPRTCDIGLYGTEQAAWSLEDGSRLFVQPRTEMVRREEPVEKVDELVEQLDELARCVREGGRPETGGPEAVDVIAVLTAIVTSIRTGSAVDVDPIRAG